MWQEQKVSVGRAILKFSCQRRFLLVNDFFLSPPTIQLSPCSYGPTQRVTSLLGHLRKFQAQLCHHIHEGSQIRIQIYPEPHIQRCNKLTSQCHLVLMVHALPEEEHGPCQIDTRVSHALQNRARLSSSATNLLSTKVISDRARYSLHLCLHGKVQTTSNPILRQFLQQIRNLTETNFPAQNNYVFSIPSVAGCLVEWSFAFLKFWRFEVSKAVPD